MITMAKGARRLRAKRVDDVSHETTIAVDSFDTELGWMAIAWRDDVLEGLVFGHASIRSAELAIGKISLGPLRQISNCRHNSEDVPMWVRDLVDRLQRYAAGEPVEFHDVPLAQNHLTTFGRRVVAACRRLKWGQSASYGELAAKCDAPGAARAVGTVMAKNRFPLVVPCHRVLASGGALGGYSAPDGLRMKRRLLTMEGSLS